jgi:sarcosine oxidase
MSTYVVVGAGLAGAATAWQLARRGHAVTVLERSTPAHPAGSSHGSARILRYAYPDPFYAGLVVAARRDWEELEALAGERLVTPTGALDLGADRDPAGLAAVLGEVGVEHELVARDEARERWPQISFDTDALWHAAAGVIDAESSVLAMLRLAEADGAVVAHDWPVASVERDGTGYRVRGTDGREETAERVVVAAGGWLPDLLGSLDLPAAFLEAFPPLTVMQENAFHFPYRDDVAPAESWPTLIHKTAALATYALPGGRDARRADGSPGQKVAEYNGGRALPSAAAQTGRVDPANRARVVDHVRRFLPGLVPEPYAETTCLFTNTPSEDFVIDGVDGVTVLSPCSGHGAKFAPLLGRLAADVATGAALAPGPFRVRR